MQVTWHGIGRFLTATELLQLSLSSSELHGHVAAIVAQLCKEAAPLQFLGDVYVPLLSKLMWLRCLELVAIKTALLQATPLSDGDFLLPNNGGVLVAKSFVLTCRKQCVKAERLLKQGPKAYNAAALAHPSKAATKAVDAMDLLAEKEIADVCDSITCVHDRLRPLSLSKSHGKRMLIPLATWKKHLHMYFPDAVYGHGLSSVECNACVQDAADEAAALGQKKTQRLLDLTSTDTLFTLAMRKSFHPPALFSPDGGTFYLVPLKWTKAWRAFAKSTSDAPPGPILNGQLLCTRHKRPVVPTSVGLFLDGASNSLCQPIPGIKTTMYEIVTAAEWEDVTNGFVAEVAVGFTVVHGIVHWHTTPCTLCTEFVDLSAKRSNNQAVGQNGRRR
ncbi:Aste57867_25126 [Aphanomyces stellatus]|uniref:Aste57867_25126 protein n=1 Tax=Aphanomyces stellatus TaxID=120398 RepID=A0A485LT80_9STRA|nr:hypothetical protein As57867_025048 [Aphanomyces stellatus]VFU01757.1 Aste57867_25126 [Aphanomyces stellatus]